MIEFIECQDRETLAGQLAAALAEDLKRFLARSDKVTFVVSGGRTPGPVYAKLSHADISWDRVCVLLSDDRLVPVTSSYSNEGLIRATLLQNCAARAEYVRLRPGTISPSLLPFDIAVLGMGEDGHIASLFPPTRSVRDPFGAEDVARCVLVNPDPLPPEAPFSRLSLNLSALRQCRTLFFVLAGLVKRKVFENVSGGSAVDTPIGALVHRIPAPVKVYWCL